MDEEVSASPAPAVVPPGETDQEPPAPNQDAECQESERAEYQTLANGHLNPRHRRFAQLVAEGRPSSVIKQEIGYSDSRISILKRNPLIAAEIARLQNRIFEETVQARLKTFAEPALNNIQSILTDRTNRVKTSEKMALSQWVVEKLDGKATQKTDIGENLLGVLMDKLDGRSVARPSPTIDVTPLAAPQIEGTVPTPEPPRSEKEDELLSWVEEFCSKTE